MVITIKEALKRAFSLLQENNINHADFEAELLIRHLYNWDRSKLFINWHLAIDDEKFQQLNLLISRRINHEPLQYILGKQEFYGREFAVNSHVLIPRPETELLIEATIKEALEIWDRPITVVDIGTGSGAIAITLFLEQKKWHIHSVDISNEALTTAEENAKNLNAEVNFHHGSLLKPLIEQSIKVDIVISNPPYIPKADITDLMEEVKDHEPILALEGGEDGLDFYRQIIQQSKEVLNNPGLIAFEIGIHQAEDIKTMLIDSGAGNIKIRPDLQGIPRVITAQYL